MNSNVSNPPAELGGQSPPPTSLVAQVIGYFAVLLLVLLVHGGSWRGEYALDDVGTVQNNRSIRDLSNLRAIFFEGTFTTVAGRPLLNLSLAVNYALGGTRPEGYHLANYGIHAAVTMLLIAVLRRLLCQFEATRSDAGRLATIVGVLWCVHPLTVNAVSYISQRAESITSLFYLLVLWSFLKGVQTSRRRWFVGSVLAAWLGALTKETIATVPLAVILMDLLLVTRDWRTALRRHAGVNLGLISSWIPLAICMCLSKARANTVGFGMGIAWQDHVTTQVWAVARYLRLFVWPRPLIFDYGDRFLVTDPGQVLVAACVLLLFVGLIALLLIRRSPLSFTGLLCGLLLMPTSVIPIATQTIAEHRMYLPSACLVTLVVIVVHRRLILAVSGSVSRRVVAVSLVLSVFCGLSVVTARHSRVLATRQSVWTDVLRKHPVNQRAVFALAEVLFDQTTDTETVGQLCRQAIAMPGIYATNAHLLLGKIYQKTGDLEQAIQHLNLAIQLVPERIRVVAPAYEHRAQIRSFQKNLPGALEDYGRAIALTPQVIELYLQRAIVLRDAGRFDEALRDLTVAAPLDPTNLNVELVHASIDIERGDFAAALRSFERLLAKSPNHVGARRRRVWVYTKLDRWQDASRELLRLKGEGRTVDEELFREVERHVGPQTSSDQ